ncbi:hypothetical protein ACGH6Q_11825, partial [Gilliamella sp. BG2]
NELTHPETSCQYALWQIHYFGHGGHDALYLQGKGNNIHFNDQDNMEVLPWHLNEGIFVLHSCRGGAYEDTYDNNMIKQQICLAKTISEKQKTRCLGQVTYGNFAADIETFNQDLTVGIGGIIVAASETTTAEQDAEVFKYRPDRVSNKAILPFASCALWGYALVTGDTLEKTLLRKKDYEEKLLKQGVINPIYPIYEEIKKLAPKKQILPCRVFNNGTLEPRIVEIDVFNQNDLEYI